jgi:hypothetical protein
VRKLLIFVSITALVLAGCSSGKKPATSSGAATASPAAKAEKLALEVAEPAAGKVTLTGPASIKAGLVEVSLKNSGKNPHVAEVGFIDPPHTLQDLLAEIESDRPVASWIHTRGGPAAPPGSTVTATLVLDPGNYYVVDYESPDGENTKPYASQGAVLPLEVTGTAAKTTLPSAKATIGAKEYTFDTKGLTSGMLTIKWENTGMQHHLMFAAPINEGKTLDDVKAALSDQSSTAPPPVDFQKGVELTVLDPGAAQVTTVDFAPGRYAFICFLTDEKNPAATPHFVEGMLKEVTIK